MVLVAWPGFFFWCGGRGERSWFAWWTACCVQYASMVPFGALLVFGVLELGLWRTWAARWHSVISSMPFCVYVHNLERILWRSVYNINSLPFVCGFFYNCLSFIYSNWASSSFGGWSHLCGEGLSFWLGCWHVVFMKKRLKCYHLLILKVLSRVLDLYFQINADSGAVQESCRGDFLIILWR